MPKRIGFKGIPEPNKPRRLVEQNLPIDDAAKQDKKPPVVTEREVAAQELYRSLAKTYLKGRALKKGLAGMDPAGFIPIEDAASEVSAAAIRLDRAESKNGTIITYSMYQKSVDAIHAQKWEVRRRYFNVNIPASGPGQKQLIAKTENTDTNRGIIKEFIDGGGVAGALLAGLVISPFMSDIFQSLSGEESGAKAVHLVKVSAGIAILLELGIKSLRIIELLKVQRVNIPNIENTVNTLASDDNARATAISSAGIDYNELKSSMESSDHKKIIDYVSEYYTRYGGLSEPNSFLTIDHWVAYLQVAQNQLVIRGALNTADSYSAEFSDIRNSGEAPLIRSTSTNNNSARRFQLPVYLASSTRALRERSDTIYDDILDSFMYQITDQDMCCLVSLFGAYEDTEILRTIAGVLRILCMDLAGEIASILALLKQFISNMMAAAIFELVNQMNKAMQDALLKITKIFTVNIEGLEKCVGLISVGWGVLNAVQVLFKMIRELMRDIMSIVNDYGRGNGLSGWTVAADRRHLLGIARILEVMADRLDVAKVCEKASNSNTPPIRDVQIKDIAVGDAIYSILGTTPPTLNLSNQEIEKYFKVDTSKTSARLKFKYGIADMQNSKSKEGKNCIEPMPKEALDEIVNKIKSVLDEE